MTRLQTESSSSSWNDQQRRYWSSLARSYDHLYQSAWSQAENDWVASRLQFLKGTTSPRILGCGTGLGAELISRWTDLEGYVGVDISPEMASITADRYKVSTKISSMDNLHWVNDHSVDVVIALFSAASFAPSLSSLIQEVARVLRPGGNVYLSTLGRDTKAFPRDATFRTRGRRVTRASVPAHRFRNTRLEEALRCIGMTNITVSGMNSFAGILESPQLWNMGTAIARRWPNTSHLLEITCNAPYPKLFQEEA